ncbi:MAG: hypothetical protein ABIP57_19750 [Jatrophihabitantaceae bacterium]
MRHPINRPKAKSASPLDHRGRLPSPRLTGWFTSATVLILGAAALAAVYGWSATDAATSRADFWIVAIPGLATGAGTLILALASVWTSRGARIDREVERRAADDLDATREARKVTTMLQHRPTGATLTVSNAGREPILDVVALPPCTTPDEHGVTYQWMPDTVTNDWQDQWFEHSRHALFIPPGGQFSISGNIFRVDADKNTSFAKAGDGALLQDKLVITWADSTGRRWQRISQADPIVIRTGQLNAFVPVNDPG